MALPISLAVVRPRSTPRTYQLKSAAQAGSPSNGFPGKKENTNAMDNQSNVMSLSGAPHLPSDHLRGSSVSPRNLFNRTQPIETMYEKINAALDTPMMAPSATVEPKLIVDKIRDTPRHTRSYTPGQYEVYRSSVWTTYCVERDLPFDRHVAYPRREWEPLHLLSIVHLVL